MIKRISFLIKRNERTIGYFLTSIAAIILSFFIGKSFWDSLKLCVIPIMTLIAGLLIVRSCNCIKSKLLGFCSFIVAMILGSLVYELYCIDIHCFWKSIIFLSPLLWLLYDMFYSN